MIEEARGTGLLDRGERPGFGQSVLHLYKSDPVWRGALDMLAIGSLVMALAVGMPDGISLAGFSSPQQHMTDTLLQPGPTAAAPSQSPATAVPNAPAGASDPTPQLGDRRPSRKHLDQMIQGDIPRGWQDDAPTAEAALYETTTDLIEAGDYDVALEMLEGPSQAGDANAQFLMGALHLRNAAIGDHLSIALYWHREAAHQDLPAAQFQVGQQYRLGIGTEKNPATAIEWYEKALAEGHAGAAGELGRMYNDADGVAKDEKKAFGYFETGAEGGYHPAQSFLGAYYANGLVVRRDYKKALYWIRQAADQGNKHAQYNLALMYKKGRGVPADPEAFVELAKVSANQGFVPAMVKLGDFYRDGEGGRIDHASAAKWYRRAALNRNASAQFRFAEMYEQGVGVPQDLIQAFVYYDLARRNGFAQADAALRNLKPQMSMAQIAHATRMVDALDVN